MKNLEDAKKILSIEISRDKRVAGLCCLKDNIWKGYYDALV